ncbi:hypothetical protein PoB_001371500, partial [Plakobranchus ocellatus]
GSFELRELIVCGDLAAPLDPSAQKCYINPSIIRARGVGGLVNYEPALRSSGALLSHVQVLPWALA